MFLQPGRLVHGKPMDPAQEVTVQTWAHFTAGGLVRPLASGDGSPGKPCKALAGTAKGDSGLSCLCSLIAQVECVVVGAFDLPTEEESAWSRRAPSSGRVWRGRTVVVAAEPGSWGWWPRRSSALRGRGLGRTAVVAATVAALVLGVVGSLAVVTAAPRPAAAVPRLLRAVSPPPVLPHLPEPCAGSTCRATAPRQRAAPRARA